MVRTVSDVLQSPQTEGKTYLLRYDEHKDEWTLESGFDGEELLARPSIQIVTFDSTIVERAEQQIERGGTRKRFVLEQWSEQNFGPRSPSL